MAQDEPETDDEAAREGEPEPVVEEGAASDLDSMFTESDGLDDDDIDGLELDDAQAGEIRNVFLATLPQYLEPVQQMLRRLASPDAEAEDAATRQALDTALESIQAAAAGVAIDDVERAMTRMRESVGRLADADDETRAALLAVLDDEVEEVGAVARAGGAADTLGAPTIFSVLSGVEGIEPAVIEKLTAAGLITVDQLQMARPDEIMAVSGLDAATVDRLLRAIEPDAAPAPTRAPQSPARTPAPADDEPDLLGLANDFDPPPPSAPPPETPAPPSGRLDEAIRARVDAEAALEHARIQVQRGRARLAMLRSELSAAAEHRTQLSSLLAREQSQLAAATKRAGELHRERERADEQLTECEAAARRAQSRIADLTDTRRRLLDEDKELAGVLADLSQRVKHMLESARSSPLGDHDPTGSVT